MPKVKPKVGAKYLVKVDYVTTGGAEFMADMERWKTHPLVAGTYDGYRYIWAEGKEAWLIRVEDLIPYKTARLENK